MVLELRSSMRIGEGFRRLSTHPLFRLILVILYLVFLAWPFVASPSPWMPGRVFAWIFIGWALLIGTSFALSRSAEAEGDEDV
jgi:hypothetical protein